LSKLDLVEADCPAGVMDSLLWRNAVRILDGRRAGWITRRNEVAPRTDVATWPGTRRCGFRLNERGFD
jgi:hypothetical protein